MIDSGKIIVVANQKGGVGKTTTTESIGIELSNKGYSILLINFDPQGDLTTCLGWKNNEEFEYTIAKALDLTIQDKAINFDEIILHHNEGVDLIPSNIELADFEMKLVTVMGREKVLSNCIQPILKKYDYVIIDCPPSLGMLTINALAAANEVLIPVQAQYLPAKGMTKLITTVNKVKSQINPKLKITGIIITLANMQTNLAKSTVETIKFNFGKHIHVFHSTISIATKIGETTISGQSIFKYAKNSSVADAYREVTKEFLKTQKVKKKEDRSR